MLHELLARNVEVTDQWGLVNVRMRAAKPDELPDEAVRIPRPWMKQDAPEDAPKKDRYQKSRERAAFFGAG